MIVNTTSANRLLERVSSVRTYGSLLATIMALVPVGCSESTVNSTNKPPTVRIDAPAEGEVALPGEFSLIGAVSDSGERDLTQMGVTWSLSGKKLECPSSPTSEGRAECVVDLEAGSYTVTFEATDSLGLRGSTSVAFEVYNGAPSAEITTKSYTINAGQMALLEGVVSDPDGALDVLAVTWESSLDKVLAASTPDASGYVSLQRNDLRPGEHLMTLHVEDERGATASDQITLIVVACTDADGDHVSTCVSSGQEADCDDGDSTVRPGAPEVCDGQDNNCNAEVDEGYDQDQDGFAVCAVNGHDADCNDAKATVFPGAVEQCNGYDDDCDGTIDEDGDGDGDGVTNCNGDCDDGSAAVHPGAAEVCDGLDNDCDGTVDEGFDQDGDQATTCGGDCDDANNAVFPAADEQCNEVDDDCDGQIDEGLTESWYADTDADGFGDPGALVESCFAPPEYVADRTDCDDGDGTIHPAATETCNSTDDNCDGEVDEGVSLSTFYADQDGDGYGNPGVSSQACAAPSATVTDNTDCDDTDADVNPGKVEICNGHDDNCDGGVDETGLTSYYPDGDGDGYGKKGSTAVVSCSAQDGFVADNTDCNDTAASIHPGAADICNSVDDDCDGQTDDGASSAWYVDADGDGYGRANSPPTMACTQPSGTVSDSSDCNDGSAAVHPGATEQCNSVDDNCDGTIDEGMSKETYYKDGDGDGYGGGTGALYCTPPSGYVTMSGDCNDGNAAINPDAEEVCANGLDDNCDDLTDGQDQDACPGGCTVDPVDGPYGKIQDALDAIFFEEIDCTTILVKAGTYKENLDFSGLNVAVQSEDGPEATIIDGQKISAVVKFSNLEGANAILSGFTLKNGTGLPCSSGRCGGGIYIANGASPSLSNNIIVSNSATMGAGVYVSGCSGATCSNPNISYCTIGLIGQGNSAQSAGGGISVSNGASATLEENLISYNIAGLRGGGLYLGNGTSQSADVIMYDQTIIRNSVTSFYYYYDGGGGFFAEKINLDVADIVLNENTSSNCGGGAVLFSANFKIDHGTLTIMNNRSTSYIGYGVGIYSQESTLSIEIGEEASRGVISGHSEGISAVYIQGGTANFSRLDFSDNSSRFAGAVYVNGGSLAVEDGTFENNQALSGEGGAIVFWSDRVISITGTLFRQNIASSKGGAMYLTANSQFSLSDAEMYFNSGTEGGAIYQENGTLAIEASYFEGNSASGSAAILTKANSTVKQSIFVGNESSGGGSSVALMAGTGMVSNCIFSENESIDASSAYAGSIRIGGGTQTLSQNTFVDTYLPNNNAAEVHARTSTRVTFVGNILYGRKNGYGLYVEDSTPITHDQNSDSKSDNAIYYFKFPLGGTLASSTVYTTNPSFMALSDDGDFCNEDYHLSSSSPYLDMGLNGGKDPDGSLAQFGAYGGDLGTWPEVTTDCE